MEKKYLNIKKIMSQRGLFIVFLYFIFYFNAFSLELLSSNGENFFYFNGNNNRIEKIDLDLSENSHDIDYVKFGFFINGKQYEIGERSYQFGKAEGNNILQLKGEFEGVIYTVEMYSSVINKSNIVFHTMAESAKKDEDIQFYCYIKPKEMGDFSKENSCYRYNDWYFGTAQNTEKVYLADETEAKEKSLRVFVNPSFVKNNQGIFVISKINKEKPEDYFWIGKNNKESYKGNVDTEKLNWEKQIGEAKQKILYSNLLMFKRGHLIVDVSGEKPVINIEELLRYIELCLLKKDYGEAKEILGYLIFDIDKNITGIIPSDFLDLNGKELYKKDNYGIFNSYYRRSVFLELYLKYLMESKDEEFYKKSFEIVKAKLIDLLVSKISDMGVEEDSGNGRIGADGYRRFIETQFETYKALELLDRFFIGKNIKDSKYGKMSVALKDLIILYYIDDINVADYPFAKNINPKNIFYVNEELFFSTDDYYYALQKNIEILKKGKNSLKEQVIFVNYLYDKKYYLMAESIRKDIEKELEGDKGIEILQKDLSLLISYLIMKEKGEIYGVNK